MDQNIYFVSTWIKVDKDTIYRQNEHFENKGTKMNKKRK